MNSWLPLLLALTMLSQCTRDPAPITKTEQPSNTPATSSTPIDLTNASEGEFHQHVGKSVTLRGKFSLSGLVGPFIKTGNASVYLKSKGPYSWGKKYERMEGRDVRITGTLEFEHFEPSPAQHPPDYFYFQAETARIDLLD